MRPFGLAPMRSSRQRTPSVEPEDEIAHLRGLDLKGLRARWKGMFRREALPHVPRHLLFAVLAYRIQADRLGDLEPAVRKVLDETGGSEATAVIVRRLAKRDLQQASLAPGTILMPQWNGRDHRDWTRADAAAECRRRGRT